MVFSVEDEWMVEAELEVGLVSSARRRRRSAEERRVIVEETLASGASVARVAQKYGVNANQVFQWRRLYRDGHLGAPPQTGMKLLPVSVAEE
jgi:transposase